MVTIKFITKKETEKVKKNAEERNEKIEKYLFDYSYPRQRAEELRDVTGFNEFKRQQVFLDVLEKERINIYQDIENSEKNNDGDVPYCLRNRVDELVNSKQSTMNSIEYFARELLHASGIVKIDCGVMNFGYALKHEPIDKLKIDFEPMLSLERALVDTLNNLSIISLFYGEPSSSDKSRQLHDEFDKLKDEILDTLETYKDAFSMILGPSENK